MTRATSEAADSTLKPMLDRLLNWMPLSPRDQEALLNLPHSVKAMEAHQYIVRERDRPTHSCVMLRGYSFRHKVVANGHRQICAIHMKGDLVDLQNSLLGVADHSVQMLSAGKVAFVPREDVERIAFERPMIGRAMWVDTLVEASIAREWIANVGRRDARTRLAHLLCEFSLRLKVAGLGEQAGWELPMTQEQLADATGMTSVHVNRSISALEAQGLIERPSPRSIVIADWKKLTAAGDFDGNYLHLRQDDPALN